VLSVVANGPKGSRLQSAANESVGGTAVTDQAFTDDLGASPDKQLLPTDDDQVVGNTQLYQGTGGRNVSITWEAESFGGIPNPHCAFTGYAIG
jgi:azurin